MKNTLANSQLTYEQLDYAMSRLPFNIRYYIEYEAEIFYNPVDILHHYNENFPFISWETIFNELKAHSASVHRRAFNGVHPQLDAPQPGMLLYKPSVVDANAPTGQRRRPPVGASPRRSPPREQEK